MPQQLLQKIGFQQFQPGQKEVIDCILKGQSGAAIFPTGAGKSLCYQLPAMQLPNITLVVSPLLALIKDQLGFMKNKGIAATQIDSTLSKDEELQTMQDIKNNQYKVLMISVERFKNERFRNFLSQVKISLLVIDEAHCISEWGHNFRPDYLKLPIYQKEFNIAQVLLLTATATPKVVRDMQEKFNIPAENIIETGFYRKNLDIQVKGAAGKDKNAMLAELMQKYKGKPVIVYVTLQKTAEMVAEGLCQKGIEAEAYHAGLGNEQREDIQQRFMQGNINCIVATIAFGMGIDKSNIRAVVHYDLPKSVENYSQEIGRAGRDGQPSDCIIFASKDNVSVLENFVYGDTPELESLQFILNTIKAAQGNWEFTLYKLSGESNIRQLTLKTLLVYLEMEGIISPAYSYFAEYRYACLMPETDIINRFKGERKTFIAKIFEGSAKAQKWSTVNFDTIQSMYNTDRKRIVAALEYFDQQGFIQLESKQMTEVYKITDYNFDVIKVSEKLHELFITKETAEIQRIHNMIAFFESDQCLHKQLSAYFGDNTSWDNCGHCSVCNGKVVTLPNTGNLKPLTGYDFFELTAAITDAAKQKGIQLTTDQLTRFLCGIQTPLFTKLKAKSLPNFALLERYPYTDVRKTIEKNLT